jgi:hypothetical protein
MSQPSAPLPPPPPPAAAEASLDTRSSVLEHAVDYAARAPSMHDTLPWRIELQPGRMLLRGDRTRQLTALDPRGRELVQTVGAALFNVRVALADAGWGAEIERIPRPDDPDLLAAVRPVVGPPDPDLAALAAFVTLRDTDRRRFTDAHVPDDVLRRLTEIAELEGVLLIPVVDEAHRLLVARLTQQADVLQSAGSGHPGGAGGRPRTDQADAEQSMVLLATRADDRPAWLCAGEARQHVLLELTRLGWVASPLPQAVEVPLTRTQLRAALTWNGHPQMLLRIGSTEPAP